MPASTGEILNPISSGFTGIYAPFTGFSGSTSYSLLQFPIGGVRAPSSGGIGDHNLGPIFEFRLLKYKCEILRELLDDASDCLVETRVVLPTKPPNRDRA